jgi:hypothetical protein
MVLSIHQQNGMAKLLLSRPGCKTKGSKVFIRVPAITNFYEKWNYVLLKEKEINHNGRIYRPGRVFFPHHFQSLL